MVAEIKEAAVMVATSILILGVIYLLAIALGLVFSFDSGLQKLVGSLAGMAVIVWGLFITPFAILNFVYRLVRLIFSSNTRMQSVSLDTVLIVVIFAIALFPVLKMIVDLLT